MDYENYDEERLQAELDLIIAEKDEREAREKMFLTINNILSIIGAGMLVMILLIVIIGIKLITM